MWNKRFVLGLAVALIILLATRLPLLRCGAFGADVPNFADEVNYVWLADSLASGNTVADTYWFRSRAPLTAMLLLGLGTLRGVPPEYAVCDFQVIQVLLWTAMLFAVTAIAATLWDRRTALGAALLLALLPDAAMLSLLVYSETLFTAALVVIIVALLLWTRQRRMGWLVLAGIAAGLGALARPTMLPLLPVFALWAVWAKDEGQKTKDESSVVVGSRSAEDHLVTRSPAPLSRLVSRVSRLPYTVSRLAPAALLVLTCALVIAPWTIRNYRAYGGLILIDTTGSVVLWSDNKPDGSDTVKDDIQLASTNPVERQRFATREALATISADPARFARKVVREATAAWGPADFDWTAVYWGDLLNQPRLGALFAQWHSVMLLALPLALLGLAYAPHTSQSAKGFRLGMVGICVVYTCMIGITHFEERYRTPFMVLLLPYAAWSLTHPHILFSKLRRPVGIAFVTLLAALGIYYSRNLWPDQWVNAQALAFHGRGYLRAGAGDIPGALADQERAGRLMSTLYEAPIAVAELRAKEGDERGAEQLLRVTISEARANQDDPSIAVVALQRLLVQQGALEGADGVDTRLTLRGRRQAENELWGVGILPNSKINLGSSDVGLLKGFYLWETTDEGERFRWSRPHADLLLSGGGTAVCLRINGARPPDVPAPVITLSAQLSGGGSERLGTITPPRTGWVWGCSAAPSDANGPWTLHLDTTSYSPFMHNQGSDTRELGVAIAQAVVRTDTPSIDAATGLLLDWMPNSKEESDAPLTLIGLNGALEGARGDSIPLTLWWRGTESPSPTTFTFVHLVDANGATVAAYNAPLAGGTWPAPWTPGEPLADSVALPLPADLPPGTYGLRLGAFDSQNNTVYVQKEIGEVQVR